MRARYRTFNFCSSSVAGLKNDAIRACVFFGIMTKRRKTPLETRENTQQRAAFAS